jgi:hypothetical protein
MTKKTKTNTTAKPSAPTGGIANLKAMKEAKQKRIAAGNDGTMHTIACDDAQMVAVTIPPDHEQPSAKEIANDANLEAFAKNSKPKAPTAGRDATKPKKGTTTAPKPEDATRAKQGETAPKAKTAKTKRLSALDLAAKVLAEAKEPLNAKAITDGVLAAGWQTTGKTPQATLYAAIIREIAAKGTKSRFAKLERGMFTASPMNKAGA